MKKLQSFWTYVARFRYVIAGVMFVLFVGLFGENSWLNLHRLQMEKQAVEAEIDRLQAIYDHDTEMLNMLESSPKAMERIARERYFMHKPNEDVYIIK